MNQSSFLDNRLLLFSTIRKFINSFVYFCLFTAVLIAMLSFGELLISTYDSMIFNGTFYDYNWLSALLPAILGLSFIYAVLTAPVSILSNLLLTIDDGVLSSNGILFKKETILPYPTIENIVIEQSPLQRFFHLASVNFNSGTLSTSLKSSLMNVEQARFTVRSIAHRASKARLYNTEFKNIDRFAS